MEKLKSNDAYKAIFEAYEKSFFKELVKLEDCKFNFNNKINEKDK